MHRLPWFLEIYGNKETRVKVRSSRMEVKRGHELGSFDTLTMPSCDKSIYLNHRTIKTGMRNHKTQITTKL